MILLVAESSFGQSSTNIGVVELEGRAELMRSGANTWIPAKTNDLLFPNDRFRTLESSRAVLRWSDLTLVRIGENTVLQIAPPGRNRPIVNLLKGVLYLFHRDKPGLFPVGTPTMSAVIRGTEFSLEASNDGSSLLVLLDGSVDVTNEFGALHLQSGQGARTQPNSPPVRTAALDVTSVVQWALYYPGIVDERELPLTGAERQAVATSLAAYRAGDLLEALAQYPAGRNPTSAAEAIYLAGLYLSVGKVSDAERLLDGAGQADETKKFADALRRLIAVTIGRQFPAAPSPRPQFATEWMALSYEEQSRLDLPKALAAAVQATTVSADFGFAWERVAELEFSFGHTEAAVAALDRSLQLSPRNAQAWALRGFLLAADNRFKEGSIAYDRAISLDAALGNAWLGRGLVKIRTGHLDEGLNDLQVAAVVEPQRALLRSYLGKGYSRAGDDLRAGREIELAKRLDRNDPTAWLYAALLQQRANRINDAVRDLETSQLLNNNRAVYRSRLLLDQDRAVRSVNLASIYQDAGLDDVAVWEASRAVSADYGNFSSHLFLANSFQEFRDPQNFNLRYETATVNEYLLANLLSPVGANTLAQSVSQQEYSRLFQSDGFGVASTTEYLSRGAWLESAAQYGVFGPVEYAISGFYHSDPGQRVNNDLQQTELSAQVKQQITARDSIYFRASYDELKAGDLAHYFDPATANPLVRVKETQEPILLTGYHREWSPGNHSLLLFGRLQDTLQVNDPVQSTLLVERNASGTITNAIPGTIQQNYESDLKIYTGEAQQIWEREKLTVIGGVRFQKGELETRNQHDNPSFFPFSLSFEPQAADSGFERLSPYLYALWSMVPELQLIGGVSYDRMRYPINFRFAPIAADEDTKEQWSPKAGLIWTPLSGTTLRGAYTRSLGGVSFDQSFRLEPTQVAGFIQSFRSLIPESVVGATAASTFDTWNISFEQQFGSGTYLGLGAELLESDVDRSIGVYELGGLFSFPPGSTTQELRYRERSLRASVYQLIGRDWSFGAQYRLSDTSLHRRFPGVDSSISQSSGIVASEQDKSLLHHLRLFGLFNHPSGLFSEIEGNWIHQDNDGYIPTLAGEDFWYFNAFVGYRFAHRHAEARLGLLNITDRDYRLAPLSGLNEMPRERTIAASFRFYF